MPDLPTRIWDDDGTSTIAVPINPDHVRILSVESLVARYLPDLVSTARAIDAVPVAGQSPQVLSEAEMRRVDPGAVRWRPGHTWLAVVVKRADGPMGDADITVYDLDPEG